MHTFTIRRLFAVACAALTVGCAAPSKSVSEVPDGIYCHRVRNTYNPVQTCTTASVPSALIEDEAKRFDGHSDLATVYLVRRSMFDTRNLVRVSFDNSASVDTIPESFIRVRMKPGSHQLLLAWDTASRSLTVEAKAGDVRFVGVDGLATATVTSYRWSEADPQGARWRAGKSKLIADLVLR